MGSAEADKYQQAEVILPENVYTDIQTSLDKLNKPQSARVFMSPSDLLEHEFFNTYIKTGIVFGPEIFASASNQTSRQYSHDIRRPSRV